MNVTVIDRDSAIGQTAQSLGIGFQAQDGRALTRTLLAQSLRRSIFIAAPCAGHVLRALVLSALLPLSDDAETLKAQIDDVLQDLIAVGDILEMVAEADGRRTSVLRPAPPAFIARCDGSFILIGISGDEITPVQDFPIVHYASGLRVLRPVDTHECRVALLDLGLIELSERTWLHTPAPMPASDLAAHWMERLPKELRPEKIEGLEILQTASQTHFYKARWTTVHTTHTGIFVARRPQRYGANLWCLVDVKNGVVQRLTDIRARDLRARDCDEAWRLQAAFDVLAGAPQKVRVDASGPTAVLSFSAPLPSWAARRLASIGEPADMPRALLAFKVPSENAQDELRWLDEYLWLVRSDEGGVA